VTNKAAHLRYFSQIEYQRRDELTQNWLRENNLAALVIYASAYGGDNIRWLTGFNPRHDTFLIWIPADEPVLLTQLFKHVPNALRVAAISDVRWGGPNSGLAVAEVLQEKGVSTGQEGLKGRLPYLDYQTLASSLPEVTWLNAG
jgi:Xaa-Pro aminopeptidase